MWAVKDFSAEIRVAILERLRTTGLRIPVRRNRNNTLCRHLVCKTVDDPLRLCTTGPIGINRWTTCILRVASGAHGPRLGNLTNSARVECYSSIRGTATVYSTIRRWARRVLVKTSIVQVRRILWVLPRGGFDGELRVSALITFVWPGKHCG